MKPSKTENGVGSIMKTTCKYSFIAPGAIGMRGGRGLRSLVEKNNMSSKSLFSQSSDIVKQYIQTIETNSIRKEREQELKTSTVSASQGMETIHKNSMFLEKEFMKVNIPLPPSTDQIKQYIQKVEISVTGKGREQMSTSLCSYLGNFENEVGSLSESALYPNQCIQTPSKVQDQVLPCLQVKKCEL